MPVKDVPHRKVIKTKTLAYGQEFTMVCGINNGELSDISLLTVISNKKDNSLYAKEIAHKIINTDFDVHMHYKLENDETLGNGRSYTFSNKLTTLHFSYGKPKDSDCTAALMITFQPIKTHPKTSVQKNIYDFLAIVPMRNDRLPFGFKWGEVPARVESVLKKNASWLRVKKQYDKNILTYSAAIKSDILAAIICGFNSNFLDTVVFYMLITNTGNNKYVSNDILKIMNTKFTKYIGGKTISYSFTNFRNSMLFLTPYVLMDITLKKLIQKLTEQLTRMHGFSQLNTSLFQRMSPPSIKNTHLMR